MSQAKQQKWWKEANAYQIWPASFQDSNSDGIGDIPGIISRLDYLKDLGIDLIWLSPVYDSPQHDKGYDISNYEDIWPSYGTLADMERLIREAKARGIRIIMDLVVNHTSNEHKWFQESARSRDPSNQYHDWYIWRDPKGFENDGTPIPPNNWRAAFGGSVWTYVEAREQFYLHLCLPEQPDLNWFNPDTRRAIYDSAIEFWLKRGVDGFRVDVVNFYWKDLSFPDASITNPTEKWQPMEPEHIINGPLMHEWLQEQRREAIDKYGDIMLVGELPATSHEEILRYLNPETRELDMIFDFDLFVAGTTWKGQLHDWKKPELETLKPTFAKTQSLLNEGKGWPTVFLENHDSSRSVDRFGPGAESPYRESGSKLLALLAATLSGTLYIYQGQEIGMTNMPSSWNRADLRDNAILRYLDGIDEQYPNDSAMKKRALEAARCLGRDNARTPVQWSARDHAGFSDGEPWIRVNDNYTSINIAAQEGKSDTVLELWRRLLRMRKQNKLALVYGQFHLIAQSGDKKLAYVKTCLETNNRIYIELNFSDESQDLLDVKESQNGDRKLLVSSCGNETSRATLPLEPWEGRAYTLGRLT